MIAITKDVWEKIKPRLEQEEVFIDEVYQHIDDTLLIENNYISRGQYAESDKQ
jgi:hypothetical protein